MVTRGRSTRRPRRQHIRGWVAGGWLQSFDNNCPQVHLTIARAFADFCLTNEIDHFTQWFPGRGNKVADILYWDFVILDDDEATSLTSRSSPCCQASFCRLEVGCDCCPKCSSCRLNQRQAQQQQLALLQEIPRTDRSRSRPFSPPIRTNRKNRNLRVFRRRPSGWLASLPTICDRWPWSHVRYHSCCPQRGCDSDLQA